MGFIYSKDDYIVYDRYRFHFVKGLVDVPKLEQIVYLGFQETE